MTDALQAEFWEWAAARYEHKELRDTLLHLQESCDLIILEALFYAWLSEKGCALAPSEAHEIKQAIAPWVGAVLLPLREQRVAWSQDSDFKIYRQALLQLELEAEKGLSRLLCSVIHPSKLGLNRVPYDLNLRLVEELSSNEDLDQLIDALGR